MKRLVVALFLLLVLAALADWVAYLQLRVPLGRYFALFVSLALVLGAFVSLTDDGVTAKLRLYSSQSAWLAMSFPVLLLIPYCIYGLGTMSFSVRAFVKLAAYVAAPNLLLLPDRMYPPKRAGWRDFAAMAALGVPVASGWTAGIWTYPFELYFFRPIYSVCAGVYAFAVIRRLDGIGFRLLWRKGDLVTGLVHFIGFAIFAIPLGYALHFIHFRLHGVAPETLAIELIGTYLIVAIPEEVLFRGILQNFLEQSFSSSRKELYALLIASPIFGASHLHHPPVPNWRYAIMATLAGFFYGNAFGKRRRTSSSALTHALVDTVWHWWF